MTRPILGALELMETAYSGFAYPARAQVVSLLAEAADAGGNAVVQSTALTLRQATISWVAPSTAEKNTVLGYFETLSEVLFTDREGVERNVRLIAFSSSVWVGTYWTCSGTMLELEVLD